MLFPLFPLFESHQSQNPSRSRRSVVLPSCSHLFMCFWLLQSARLAKKRPRSERELEPYDLSPDLSATASPERMLARAEKKLKPRAVTGVPIGAMSTCDTVCRAVTYPPNSEKELQLLDKIRDTVPRYIYVQYASCLSFLITRWVHAGSSSV